MSVYHGTPYMPTTPLTVPSRAYSGSGYASPYPRARSVSHSGSIYREPRDYDYEYQYPASYDGYSRRSYSTGGGGGYGGSYYSPEKRAYSYTTTAPSTVITYAQPSTTQPMVYTTAQPYRYGTYGQYYGQDGCCSCCYHPGGCCSCICNPQPGDCCY